MCVYELPLTDQIGLLNSVKLPLKALIWLRAVSGRKELYIVAAL